MAAGHLPGIHPDHISGFFNNLARIINTPRTYTSRIIRWDGTMMEMAGSMQTPRVHTLNPIGSLSIRAVIILIRIDIP